MAIRKASKQGRSGRLLRSNKRPYRHRNHRKAHRRGLLRQSKEIRGRRNKNIHKLQTVQRQGHNILAAGKQPARVHHPVFKENEG